MPKPLTQFFAGEGVERLEVTAPGVGDNLVGQGRRRGLFVPAQRFQVIPEILLVVALLGAAGPVVLLGPEAGGVRGQDLVDEQEFFVTAIGQAELELGVGNDDAPGLGPGQGPAAEGQAQVPDLRRQRRPELGRQACAVEEFAPIAPRPNWTPRTKASTSPPWPARSGRRWRRRSGT